MQSRISSVVKGKSGRGVTKKLLVPLRPLKKVEITRYFKYESRFSGVFSGNNLSRIKDGATVIHCVLSFSDRSTAVYFDSFGIEYIPQEVLKKIQDKLITHSIFRIQDWIWIH